MNYLDHLTQLFKEYIDFAEALRNETMSVKSVLGMRDREIYHPGHSSFLDSVGDFLHTFKMSDPNQEDIMKALEIILLTAANYEHRAPFWYLIAVQKYATDLIPLLDPVSIDVLRDNYEKCYPRNAMLPIQKDIYKLLQKEKSAEKRKRFWK